MKFEYIGSFEKGEPVPDWLLSMDPTTPGPPITITFSENCHVFETTGGIWIAADVPCRPDRAVKQICINAPSLGGEPAVHRMAAVAPSGTVLLPHGFQILGGGSDGEWEFDTEPTPVPRTNVRA